MKILFGVCTEGSGHTVQSIAMKQILGEKHDIVGRIIVTGARQFGQFSIESFLRIFVDSFQNGGAKNVGRRCRLQ